MNHAPQGIDVKPSNYETFFFERGIPLPKNFHERLSKFEEFSKNDPTFPFKFATVFAGDLYPDWVKAHHTEPGRFSSAAINFFHQCAQLLDVPPEIVESEEKLNSSLASVIEASALAGSLVHLYLDAHAKNTGCVIS